MEARADLEQRPDPAAHGGAADRRPRDPRKNLEQGALTRTVGPDQAERLAVRHFERYVAECPELERRSADRPTPSNPLERRAYARGDGVAEHAVGISLAAQEVALAEAFGTEHHVAHR